MTATRPRSVAIVRGRAPLVAALLLVSFIVAMEATVISAVMPVVVDSIGGLDLYTWAFSVFLLVQTVTMPIYGRLADRVGRKPLFIWSMALFVTGSVGCGAAQSMVELIAWRALQALGAAGLTPIGATMMGDMTSAAERPRFLGYVSAAFGLAALVGPPIGAFIVETVGWPWVFWLPVPLGLVAGLVIFIRFQEPFLDLPAAPISWPSTAVFTVGAGSTILGLLEAQRLGIAVAGPLIVLGMAAAAAAMRRDVKQKTGLIPLHLLASPLLKVANTSAFLCGAVMMSVTVFLPMYMAAVLKVGPLGAGAALGIMSITWTIANVVTGRVLGRLRYREAAINASWFILAGTVVLLAAIMTRTDAAIYVGCATLGIGLGVHSITFTVASQSSVGATDRARSTTLFYFVRRVGQTAGVAVLGGLLNFIAVPVGSEFGLNFERLTIAGAEGFEAALRSVFATIVLIAALTMMLALRLPKDLRVSDTAIA